MKKLYDSDLLNMIKWAVPNKTDPTARKMPALVFGECTPPPTIPRIRYTWTVLLAVCCREDCTVPYRAVIFCNVRYRTVLNRTVRKPYRSLRTVLHRTERYRAVLCRTLPYYSVHYRTFPYRTVSDLTVPYSTLLYCTVLKPYRTALYHTVFFVRSQPLP